MIVERVLKSARTAMKREIASWTVTSAEYVRSSGGWEVHVQRISLIMGSRLLCRLFSCSRSDTHGLAYRKLPDRTQRHKLSTLFKEETTKWLTSK